MNLTALIAAAQAHSETHRRLDAEAEALDLDMEAIWDDSADVLRVHLCTAEAGNIRAVDAVAALGSESPFANEHKASASAQVGDVVLVANRR